MNLTLPAAFTRRDALRLGASALAGVALAAGADARDDGGFSFVVVNDLHFRDARCGPWFERVVTSIRALRPQPAFVVLAGDLSESGTRAQLGAVREIFRALPMPVRAVIGNHDYAADGSRAAYEALFGARRNFRFDHAGWQYLALDTTEGAGVYRTRIQPETLAWMDRAAPQLSRDRPLVVLTHFPLGRNWLRPVNARAVLDRLRGHDLRAAFSGHWHGLTERVERGVTLRTGRCCSWWRGNHDGSDLKGYVLAHAGDAGVQREFVAVA